MTSRKQQLQKQQRQQQLIASVCITFISVMYIGVYAGWQALFGAQPERSVAATYVTKVVPGPAPAAEPIFIPDYQLPSAQSGFAPVIYRVPTFQPVVFLTIDDGVFRHPEALALLKENHIKATLFLVNDIIAADPGYFANLAQGTGSVIENHTVDHKLLTHLNYDQQKQEICGNAEGFAKQFGKRPRLFRPPGGDFNAITQRAAADCGMKAVVMWHAKANGGSMQYQVGDKLLPGDIVLMHFRPEFKQDFQAFIEATKAAGLHPQLLEDWMLKG